MLTKKQIKKNTHETFVHLGRQLYEHRLALGMTIEQLAMKTSVAPHYFDKIESGKGYLPWGMLSYLAGCYDCKIKIELLECHEGREEL